ncbi:MAG: SIMPL domain-containing protein [Flavobacteriaceae bacterium]|nr:SIMPL domain-containing protein [Flavobacteriaceae bacterium]
MNKIFGFLTVMLIISCQPTETYKQTRFKTIMIKAVGEIETLPDLASFRISLNCLKKSVKSSKNCLVDKSNELNQQLLDFGINQNDILTTSVDMTKSYSWSKNTRVFIGYNSSTTMYITIRDLNILDEIYTNFLENRNLDLGNLSYSHSKLDSLRNEAYISALKKSNILADKLIDELPENEKEIIKIGSVKISSSLPEPAESKNEARFKVTESENIMKAKSISISKGTVLVNATLYVEYYIK